MESDSRNISALLEQCDNGDRGALDRLIEIVYPELRRRARGVVAGRRHDPAVQPTILVHEFCMRLMKRGPVGWENRSHFFSYAAQAMRHILTDFERRRRARGGEPLKLDSDVRMPGSSVGVIEIDHAVSALAQRHPRKAKIMELLLFGGFTVKEIAECLHIDVSTVNRDRKFAEAWLMSKLTPRSAVLPQV